MKTWIALGAAIGSALTLSAPARAEGDTPPLVAAYTDQLVRQCSTDAKPVAARNLVERLDLNGDKIDDWVIDASRQPCPTRPAIFADAGSQVTLFKGAADGRALPALQRTAYGARIEGKPATGYSLWLKLGGSDCGEADAKARCDRQVVWKVKEARFEVTAPVMKAAGPKAVAAK